MPKFLDKVEISTSGSQPPLVVNSTALVLNLNAAYLGNQPVTYFATADHAHLNEFQPVDADLTAIAALQTAVSNRVLIKNSSGAWALTERTGTGKIASEVDAVLVNPTLGTPASGDLSNCTGYKALERRSPFAMAAFTSATADSNKLYLGNSGSNLNQLHAWNGSAMQLVDCGNAKTANQADNSIQLGGLPASNYSSVGHNHGTTYASGTHDHSGIYSPTGHSHTQLLNVGLMNQASTAPGYLRFDGTSWSTQQLSSADITNTAGYITSAGSAAQLSGMAATSAEVVSSVVSRDTSGSFVANVITATLAGKAASATTLAIGADRTKLDGIAVGATANTGTVTAVSGLGSVSGLTLTGSISSSGSLTLGGTLSVTPTNFSGILPVAKGGTGQSAAAASAVFIAPTAVSGAPSFRQLQMSDLPSAIAYSTAAKTTTTAAASPCSGFINVNINGTNYKLMVTG